MGTPTQLAELPTGETAGAVKVDLASCALLRALATLQTEDSGRRIDRLAGEIHDWDALLKLSQEHGVLPMLHLRLEEMGVAIPPVVQDRLRAGYHCNVFHSFANAAELIDLLRVFDREAIPAMPFKGVVLGAAVYGDLTMRPAGDLDILIHHRDLARAAAIMLERGYELRTPMRADGSPVFKDNHENQFERTADGMIVELRWQLELVFSRFTRKLGLDWVWPARRTAIVAGAEVPDMNPEMTLLMLCRHGSKHVWPRLIWICDVARLLDSEPGLNWNGAIQEAKRRGLWRALAIGVLLAHRVGGAPVPRAHLRRFEADASALRVARHIEEHLFDAPGSTPEGPIPYNIQLLGFRDRLRLVASLGFLQPNEKDFEAINLPKPLRALYWVVHPIRVLLARLPR